MERAFALFGSAFFFQLLAEGDINKVSEVKDAVLQNHVVRPATGSRTFLWLLLSLAAIIRIFVVLRLLPDNLFDDGYVTLRYADNLIRGLGLVYNAGEHVMGTTSPLFTFLLAAGGRLFGPNHLPALAVSFGIAASLGTLYFCERILEMARIPSAVKWNYLAVLAFLPSFLLNSTSGMETPVVLFLMSVSLYLCMKDRLVALSIIGFLLFLSRIDTGLWLLALAIHLVVSKRGKLVRSLAWPLALFIAPMAAWLTFTKIYFGTIIPESLTGKAVSHSAFVMPDWHYVLTYLSAFVPAERFGVWGLALIAVVFVVLAPFAFELWRTYPPLRPLLYFFVLYVTAFVAARAPLFSWYEIPPKWAFYLLVTYALWRILCRIVRTNSSTLKPQYALAFVGVLAFFLGVRAAENQYRSPRVNPFVNLSNYIEQNLPAHGSVFLEHIGLVGYKTHRYIYDSMGLVTPETVRLKRLYGPAWLPKAAREYHADLVVLYEPDLPAVRSQTDVDAIWFQQNYTEVNEDHGLGPMLWVFLKNDRSENTGRTGSP
jgi:hypothetical protein